LRICEVDFYLGYFRLPSDAARAQVGTERVLYDASNK
jgi:hypothetical protein